MSHLRRNSQAWNRMADGGSQFAKVASDDECLRPLEVLDGRGWLPASVHGLDVLCLAAGGGWQSILYASAGAKVTVVDLSASMLRLDIREANRRNLTVRTVQASMDDLSALGDATFDIVHQPVSTCYVPRIAAVYAEVARVLRDGGVYVSQHKQPTSLQITGRDERDGYTVGVEYYLEVPLPKVDDDTYRESRCQEFLHRWEQLVGELCRTGFVLEDLSEPYRADESQPAGHFGHRGRYVPPYVRLKARRRPRNDAPARSAIWTPQ